MVSNEKMIRLILKLDDQVTSGANSASTALNKLSSTATSLGTQMTAAFTVPIVAAGAAGVKLAVDLDKAMRNIQSITKQTDESLALLSDQFVTLSMDMSKTTDSAQNLADGYYQIISSGIDAADAMKVLEVATKAASAGLTTTEVAAKGIITVLNSYKLGVDDASRVSDILFETVNRGVGTFEELNAALSNVVPTASVMNISLEEVSAGMATLSKNGFSFSEASVAMNNAMNAFLKPSEAMTKAIHAMGYESGQAMIDALGFGGAMQKVQQYTGGSSEALAELFPEIRGFRAAAILAGKGADTFAEDLAAMGASTGATSAAFAEQMKSFDASWKNFQNTLNAALIDIGQTMMPVLAGIMNFLTPIIQGFMALPEPLKQIIIVFAALLAALGPVLIIFGQIAGAISTIIAIWPALVAGFGMVAGAIATILSPLGLLIAGVVLLGTAITQNWFGLRDGIVSFFGMLVTGLSKVGDTFKAIGGMILQGWKNIFHAITQMGAGLAQGLWDAMVAGFKRLVVWILSNINNIITQIRKAFGIASPSKVMAKIGEQVVAGFHKGIESMGGIGVNVPQAGGGMQSRQPALAVAGGGAGGGSGNVYINTINVPAGTSQEQVKHIMKEIGKEAKRKGARSTRR